jgi:serine/threonine-protein kinase|tara:strand:- start:893 stop:2917 length:2025 start_codon:yes stop_codon:yes gene_type:complete
MKNRNEKEKFFKNLDPSLASISSFKKEDLTVEELEAAYPIQNSLKRIEDPYQNIELIGQGGFKKIYKARDLRSGQNIGLALPSSELKKETIEAFLREARLTASLQHPNIITIHEIGFRDSKVPFFSMELLGGMTLEDKAHKFLLNSREKLEIFFKICDAIAYAHSKSILHLDLKPKNIQIGDFGEVHVCDWGLAKVATYENEFIFDDHLDPNIVNHGTLMGQMKGSPGFMAPEQASKMSTKDERTDIYSLGAILYYLYTSEAPIHEASLELLIEKTKESEIRPITDYPQVLKPLQSIIQKCLQKEPDLRYQKVVDLKKDLENFVHGFATIAENPGLYTHLKLLVYRQKKAVFTFLAFVIALTAVLLVSFDQINEERELAVTAKNNAIEAKVEAEENHRLYIENQRLNQVLVQETEGLVTQIASSQDLQSAKNQIKTLLDGLKRVSGIGKRRKIEQKLGLLYFVLTDFPNALEYLKRNPENNQDLYKASLWAIENLNVKAAYSDLEIAKLLLKIYDPKNLNAIEAVYLTHMKKADLNIRTADTYIPLASVVLNAINNKWGEWGRGNLAMALNGKILKLASEPYKFLRIPKTNVNVLQPLSFEEFVVGEGAYFDVVELEGLQFPRLNLVDSRPYPLNLYRIKILKKKGIRQISYNRKFLTSNEIQRLNQHFQTQEF